MARATECMRGIAAMAALLITIAAAGTGTAHAELSPAPGYALDDWATGFPVNADGIGPVGLAVRGGKVYVGAFPAGRIYVFDQGTGGEVGPANELTSAPIPGQLTGLAFDKAGRLYGALKAYGLVVELSLVDGHVLRTVASGLPCALGLATDPLSGDLFVSQPCAPGVKRLHGSASGPATVSQYTYTAGAEIDGIEFGADGTLYGADFDIFRIAGTNQPDAGAAELLASVPGADGLAVAASALADRPPFLLTITTRGTIEKVDLSSSPASVSKVAIGGSRGDLGVVGSDGCLYATQSDRVVRVTSSGGGCGLLLPTLPNRPPFTVPAITAAQAAATATRSLRILSLPRSARSLTRARRVRARAKLVGPPLLSVRLTLVDARGRILAHGTTARLTGTSTLTLKRTRVRVRRGLVWLRASGRVSATKRVTLVASRRLHR